MQLTNNYEFLKSLTDTHREKLPFIQFSARVDGWLLLTFLIFYTINYVPLYILLSGVCVPRPSALGPQNIARTQDILIQH